MSSDSKVCSRACDEVRQLLEAPDPMVSLSADLENHLKSCPECQALRAQIILLDDITRDQAPELPRGFELSLRRRLSETVQEKDAGSKEARRHIWVPVVFAAAVMILVAGAVLLAGRWFTERNNQSTYHRLELSIQSTRDYEEVRFDIDLPRGVRALPATAQVIGAGQKLTWRSNVRRGTNEIDLPLVASSPRGQVKIRLTAGKRSWTGFITIDQGTSSTGTSAGNLQLAWAIGDHVYHGDAR